MFIGVSIIISSLILAYFTNSIVEKLSYSKMTLDDVNSEFEKFSIKIITKRFFDRASKSQVDANGRLVAIYEFSNIESEFFQGTVAYIAGSMGIELKRRIKLFYDIDDELLINKITEIVENYTIILAGRTAIINSEVMDENKQRIHDNKPSMTNEQIQNRLYEKLIISISLDLMKFVNVENGLTGSK